MIIPVYNDEEYLPRALHSVKNQTYGKIEAIVVDSGNSMEVRKICQRYDFCSYFTDEPRGVAAARNLGIEKAGGKFIGFLDADDVWLPDKAKKQVEALGQSNADFIFSQEYRIGSGEIKLYKGIDHRLRDFHVHYFKKGKGIGCRTVIVTSSSLEKEQFWEELYGREDPHLWVRLLAQFDSMKLEEPLALKQSREDSLTSDQIMMAKSEIKSIEDLTGQYPELEKYKVKRLKRAYYKLGYGFFQEGYPWKARRYIRKSGFVPDGIVTYKPIVIYILTFFPLYQKQIYNFLSELKNRIHSRENIKK